MTTFTEDELESIVYAANERADALRGYVDTNRINGEAHWRGIAEKADREHGRMVRARYAEKRAASVDPTTALREALTALVDVEGAIRPEGVVRELFLEARQALELSGSPTRDD